MNTLAAVQRAIRLRDQGDPDDAVLALAFLATEPGTLEAIERALKGWPEGGQGDATATDRALSVAVALGRALGEERAPYAEASLIARNHRPLADAVLQLAGGRAETALVLAQVAAGDLAMATSRAGGGGPEAFERVVAAHRRASIYNEALGVIDAHSEGAKQ